MSAIDLLKTYAASWNAHSQITQAIHVGDIGNLRVTIADGSITVTFARMAAA